MNKLHYLTLLVGISLLMGACASAQKDFSASPARAEAVGDSSIEAKTASPQGPTPSNVTVTPLLIYTAHLTLEAKEDTVAPLTAQIIDKTKALGGYMSQRSTNSVVLRVPAKEFNTLNGFIKSLSKVKYENVSAQDVTLQYTDLKIRLDVQTKMLARYQELLKKAVDVKEAVEVERELSRITESLEQLKGQIRYYDSQISYSTINVGFQEPYSAFTKETKPGPLGWVFYGLYVGIKWLFIWD